jgi:hypothetical protein
MNLVSTQYSIISLYVCVDISAATIDTVESLNNNKKILRQKGIMI